VTPTPDRQPASGQSGLPTVAYVRLPNEAKQTITLIDQGGPFPFDKDGAIFQNREGLLPRKPRGYYREYTVITPGEDDRGARRIVAGEDEELYYTDDHYSSFHEVIR
jgi:ribonuclease T1